MEINKHKIPIFIITGFLGSGKTTLLNELLIHPTFAKSAVIINEFGETSLDHHLVSSASDEIIELANGCLWTEKLTCFLFRCNFHINTIP